MRITRELYLKETRVEGEAAIVRLVLGCLRLTFGCLRFTFVFQLLTI